MSPGVAAIVGVYQTPLRRGVVDQSLEEMIFEAARGALADAGLTINDIDAITLSTTDQVEGRVIESMVTTGAAGGVGRDVTTLASAGEHAFVYAYIRIKAGQARRILTLAWSKESESVNPSHADWLCAEPFLLRPLGMTSRAAAGLQASAYVSRYGLDEKAVRAVRDARAASWAKSSNAVSGTTASSERLVAWPLTDDDLPRGCDAAAAAVMVAADAVSDDQVPAWIEGVGWISDRYELAERDLSRFDSLAAAVQMALGANLVRDVDVVEVQEISSIASFAVCEALGLAEPGKGARSAVSSAGPVINPSGGNLPANPGNAAGYLRIVNAAQQIRGRAGTGQVEPKPRSAIGAAMNGFAGQSSTVVLFSSEVGEN
jgi:acetyl-CoA C-acetyltransferase